MSNSGEPKDGQRGHVLIDHKLKDLFDCFYDGVWICDKTGVILHINKASERLNNVRAADLMGKNVKDFISKGHLEKSVTLEVLGNKRPFTLVRERVRGKKVLVTGTPVLDEKGDVSLVIMNERDITELNQLKEELEESKTLSQEYSEELKRLRIIQMERRGIVGRSEAMLGVLDLANKVARFDTVVLLMGESGVGKGLIAGLIHRLSNRRNGPFMSVTCSAIPESLIEAELFGYDKGAFTGAAANGKPGLFELAEQGTLFIDEVAETSISIQTKLLKFLEDGQSIRLGGTKWRKIDTRIIAATNRNLKEMMERGAFREDLFYRLNVVPIVIPPVRERPEDITPLIHYFLNYFNRRYHLRKKISKGAMDALFSYSYPGNVRELRNIIENLVVVSEGDFVTTKDVPREIGRHRALSGQPTTDRKISLPEILRELERKIVLEAIRKHKTTTKAANALGVSQPTIVRKLKKHRISRNTEDPM